MNNIKANVTMKAVEQYVYMSSRILFVRFVIEIIYSCILDKSSWIFSCYLDDHGRIRVALVSPLIDFQI